MRARCGTMSAILLFLAIKAPAQNIIVHALDGNNGKPLADVRLLVFTFNGSSFRDSNDRQSFDLHTDRNGTATIKLEQIKGDHLQVWVDFMTRCVNDINSTPAISVNQTLTSGVTDTNSCSNKITAGPTPGALTIYAREATLREKLDW